MPRNPIEEKRDGFDPPGYMNRRDFLKLAGTGLGLAAGGSIVYLANRLSQLQVDAAPIYKTHLPIILRNSNGQPEPTPTPTPILTPEPTPTPTPEIPWETIWFNGGDLENWPYPPLLIGGKVEVIPDPTGSGRVNVLKAFITDEGVPPPEYVAPYWKRRAQPGVMFGTWYDPQLQPAPIRVGADYWYSQELKPIIDGPIDRWQDCVSIFGTYTDDPNTSHHIVDLGWWGSDQKLHLGIVQLDDSKIYCKPQAPIFTPENWHSLRIEINAQGNVIAFQDDIIIGTTALLSYMNKGLSSVHWGLYCGTKRLKDDYPEGAYLLKDNHFIDIA